MDVKWKFQKVSVFDWIIPSNKQQTLYNLLYFCSRFLPSYRSRFPPPVLPLPALFRPLFSRAPAPLSPPRPNSFNNHFHIWPSLSYMLPILSSFCRNLAELYGSFQSCSHHRIWPFYRDFVSCFSIRSRAGPCRSFDKVCHRFPLIYT